MSLISLGLGYRFRHFILQSKEFDMEVQIAKQINKYLLPDLSFKYIDDYLYYLHIPPKGLGGDLNCIYLIKNFVIIVQIDVSGHNIGTSVISSLFKGYIDQMIENIKVKELNKNYTKIIVKNIYNYINKKFNNHHLSLIVVFIDLKKEELNLVRSGHPYPIVVSNDLNYKILESSGSILHPDFFIEPEILTYKLKEKDTFYFFSDGIFELEILKEKNQFSERKFYEYLIKHNHLSLKDILRSIYRAYKFMFHTYFLDDISIIGFRYSKEIIQKINPELSIYRDQ